MTSPFLQGTQQGAKPNVPKKKFQGKGKSRQINTADSAPGTSERIQRIKETPPPIAEIIRESPPPIERVPPENPPPIGATSKKKFAGKLKGFGAATK